VDNPEGHYLIGDLRPGQVFRWRRTISEEDLLAAVRLTHDRGGYHVDPAFARRAGFREAIAPGLLQASLFTKIGGDLNFLARDIGFRYFKPVYAGDCLDVEVTIKTVEPDKNRISIDGRVINQSGEVVVTCESTGYLPRPEWGVPEKPRLG